jgi:hypothetical protein
VVLAAVAARATFAQQDRVVVELEQRGEQPASSRTFGALSVAPLVSDREHDSSLPDSRSYNRRRPATPAVDGHVVPRAVER